MYFIRSTEFHVIILLHLFIIMYLMFSKCRQIVRSWGFRDIRVLWKTRLRKKMQLN